MKTNGLFWYAQVVRKYKNSLKKALKFNVMGRKDCMSVRWKQEVPITWKGVRNISGILRVTCPSPLPLQIP